MDIKEVKEEIKQDEELLVKIFKLEKFLKKYKKPIIAVIVLTVAILIGRQAYIMYKDYKIKQANTALEKLMSNPNDKEALNTLKEDKKLYDLYLLQKGEYSKITTKALQEIKAYETAMQKGDIKSLESYLNNPDYHILKNSVRVALIRLYLEKGQRQKAELLAQQISPNSKYKEIATYLLHYGIVK
jgi:predicted negative regulator of RcsB-dependent stress response